MAGCCVYRSCALFQRHVVGEHGDRIAVIERMAKPNAIELSALEGCYGRRQGEPDGLADMLGQLLREHDDGVTALVGTVRQIGMERDREVRWNGPGRRRPDQAETCRPATGGATRSKAATLSEASGNST